MAGTGKGPLRIAFEDFITTSTVWKIIKDAFIKVGEGLEQVEASYYSGFASIILNNKDIPDDLKAMLPLKTGTGHQGGILGAAAFAGQIGSSAASALLAPLMKLLNYAIDGKVRSARFEMPQVIQALWRNDQYSAILANDAQNLGWSDDRIKVARDVLQPRVDEQSLVHYWLRGKMSDMELSTELQRRGWSLGEVDKMLELSKVIPSINDLMAMANRLVWDEGIASQFNTDANFEPQVLDWARKQGLSDDFVKRYWRMHWQIPSIGQGLEMLHRLRPGTSQTPFTLDDLNMLYKIGDYPQFWWPRFTAVAYNPYTRVDVRRMYGYKVLTRQDVKDNYLDLGYDDAHAEKLTAFTIAYEDALGQPKPEKAKDLNQGTITDAYRKKVIDRAKAESLLTTLLYDPDEIKIILDAADFKAVVDSKPDYKSQFMTDLRTLIENAYGARMVSRDDATSLLKGLLYNDDEIKLLLDNADYKYNESVLNETLTLLGKAYIQQEMSYNDAIGMLGKLNIQGAQQSQLFAEWDNQITLRSDKLTEAQYRSAAVQKIISVDEYKTAMIGLGYSDTNIDLLVKMYLTPKPPAA